MEAKDPSFFRQQMWHPSSCHFFIRKNWEYFKSLKIPWLNRFEDAKYYRVHYSESGYQAQGGPWVK